jgi:hypothetical protein
MTNDREVTVPSVLSELNRIIVLLAVVVLAAAIAGFFIVAQTLHQVIWRAMFLGVISSVIASVLIYIALYLSLSRVVNLRREVWRQDLIHDIAAAVSSNQPLPVQAIDPILPNPENRLIAHGHVRPAQKDIIQRFLNATYLLVAVLTKNRDIRLYCHVADEEEQLLYPISIASIHINDDYRVAIPYEGAKAKPFIIAKAMKEQRIVAEDLPPDHNEWYPEELKTRILATLKCVIALPILAYDPADEDKAVPVGTISIDCSSASLRELGMVNDQGVVVDEINDILKSCARVVHRVLTLTELV